MDFILKAADAVGDFAAFKVNFPGHPGAEPFGAVVGAVIAGGAG